MSPSFQDQELEILRKAVDKNQKKIRKKIVSNPDIKRIINIVEKFLVQNNLSAALYENLMEGLQLIIFYQSKINFMIEK